MTILGKKQMSEEDIKLNYITPVILKGWKGHITMETKITDGRINIRGNIVARSKPKFAGHEAQIFQVALGLCVSANLQDHVLLADVCQCKRHHSGTLHYTR